MSLIIVHIPKTGGTSLVMNLLNLQRPPEVGFNYRHIDASKKSNSLDLFEHPESFQEHTIILLIRNLLDRAESEYNFLRNRAEFIDIFLGIFPESFEEYVNSTNTMNLVLKFLLGKKMFSNEPITQADLDQVISSLEKLNVIYGMTSEFPATLSSIEYATNVKIQNNVIKMYRQTVYKEPRDETNWSRIKKTFYEFNTLDQQLYEFIEERFQQQVCSLPSLREDFKLIGDRYHSLLLYVNFKNRCPLSIFKPDSRFVRENKKSLDEINNLSKNRAQGNGLVYAQEWLKLFSKQFNIDIKNLNNPLYMLECIGKAIE